MRIVAIINQKGGVGKTTTSVNLSHALALNGLKILLVDMDPQGHLTAHLGLAGKNDQGAGDLLLEQPLQTEWILEARDGLTLLPSGKMLGRVEEGIYSAAAAINFKRALEELADNVDLIMIDCPPASGTLIKYVLGLATEILVPVSGDYLALRGLSDLMFSLNRYQVAATRRISQWLVITRYHMNRKLSAEVRDKLLEYFPGQLLNTPIREATALAECAGHGKTIFEYKKGSNGLRDYKDLADDFINRRFAQ